MATREEVRAERAALRATTYHAADGGPRPGRDLVRDDTGEVVGRMPEPPQNHYYPDRGITWADLLAWDPRLCRDLLARDVIEHLLEEREDEWVARDLRAEGW